MIFYKKKFPRAITTLRGCVTESGGGEALINFQKVLLDRRVFLCYTSFGKNNGKIPHMHAGERTDSAF